MGQAHKRKQAFEFVKRHQKFLTETIEKFINDCEGQEPERIKELHKQYNKIWLDYANYENGEKRYGMLEDAKVLKEAFVDATTVGTLKALRRRAKNQMPPKQYEETRRIFLVVKKPTLLRRFFKNFFVKDLKPRRVPSAGYEKFRKA